MYRRLSAIAAAALLLAGCVGLIGGNPGRLVLGLADLPPGFVQVAAGPYTNADMAQAFAMPPAQVQGKLGRLDGYQAEFFSKGPILRVDSTVSLYQGAVAARHALRFEIATNRRINAAERDLNLPRVGAQSTALQWTAIDAPSHVTLDFIAIYWRRNNALGAVVAVGRDGSIRPAEVLKLAQAQDAKFRRAL